MAKSRNRYIDVDVQYRIEALAHEGFGGAQIERELLKDEGIRDRLPTLRTIQSIVREVQSRPDKSGPWRVEHMAPEDAAIVLSVFAAMASSNRRKAFSADEASWIVRLSRMYPDIQAPFSYYLASIYIQRRAGGKSTDDLDAYLGFQPWRSDAAFETYAEAIAVDIIPPPPPLAFYHLATAFRALTPEYLQAIRDEIAFARREGPTESFEVEGVN